MLGIPRNNEEFFMEDTHKTSSWNNLDEDFMNTNILDVFGKFDNNKHGHAHLITPTQKSDKFVFDSRPLYNLEQEERQRNIAIARASSMGEELRLLAEQGGILKSRREQELSEKRQNSLVVEQAVTSERLRLESERALSGIIVKTEEQQARNQSVRIADVAMERERQQRIGHLASERVDAQQEAHREQQMRIKMAVDMAERERVRRMLEQKSMLEQPSPVPMANSPPPFNLASPPFNLAAPGFSNITGVGGHPQLSITSVNNVSPVHNASLLQPPQGSPPNMSMVPMVPGGLFQQHLNSSRPLFNPNALVGEPKAKKFRGVGSVIGTVTDSPEQPCRRQRKNCRERQRRNELNEQFVVLCELLCFDSKGKTRKSDILTEAINEIRALRQENLSYRCQVDSGTNNVSPIQHDNNSPLSAHSTPPTAYDSPTNRNDVLFVPF